MAREDLLIPMAGALAQRGVVRAFVVHGKDAEGQGLDEASTEGPTRIVEVTGDRAVERAVLVPRELGLGHPPKDALVVGDRGEALRLALGFHGGAGHPDFVPALADAVALQAGLGLLLHRGLALGDLPGVLGEARARLDAGFPLPLPHLLEGA